MIPGSNPTTTASGRVLASDAANHEVIGEVLNASRAGLLVISARPFQDQERIDVRLSPSERVDAAPVEVTLESVYCEPSQFNEHYGVGFAILAIQSGDLRALFPQIARARFGVTA